MSERVGHTRHQGSLRADDDQVDRQRPRKPEQSVTIVRGGMTGRERGDPGVPGRRVQIRESR